jgi:hypothetical protein
MKLLLLLHLQPLHLRLLSLLPLLPHLHPLPLLSPLPVMLFPLPCPAPS